jgi:UDP-N-acetylmuramoylalanine--D-glutamate ligase
VAAVHSFRGAVTLIAGGYDKGLDLAPLARAAAESAEVLVTMGQTGPALAAMARQQALYAGRALVVREARNIEEAVLLADALAMPGSAVVFSPGCASYDMFENFDHRGKVFKELVRTRLGRRDVQSRGA